MVDNVWMMSQFPIGGYFCSRIHHLQRDHLFRRDRKYVRRQRMVLCPCQNFVVKGIARYPSIWSEVTRAKIHHSCCNSVGIQRNKEENEISQFCTWLISRFEIFPQKIYFYNRWGRICHGSKIFSHTKICTHSHSVWFTYTNYGETKVWHAIVQKIVAAPS